MKKEWFKIRLGDIVDISTGKLDANAADENGLYPFFTCAILPLRINRYAFDCECVLVAGNGDLNVKYFEGKFNAYQRTYVITAKEIYKNKIVIRYLYHFYSLYINQLRKDSQGSTIKYIRLGNLTESVIPFPLINEQQKIVDYLDGAFAKIDQLKANAEKQLQDAQSLFAAALEDAMRPKEGWVERLLIETATDFSRGKSKHRPRNDKKLFGGEYPFIQTGEIRNAIKYIEDFSTTYNEFGLQQSKIWPKGTICITIAANIAEVAILNFPCCFPDSVIGLVPNTEEFDTDFVYYVILSFQNQLKKLGKGAAQDNINLGTFETIKLPFPNLQTQQSIVSHLDALSAKVNQLKENYKTILSECDALKQALLREIFE